MKTQLVIETKVNGQYAVELIQTGFFRFTVIYGKHIKVGLNYGEAAKEYGECVMHALTCGNLIKND